jgi:flagellar protein FlbD
MIKLTRLSQEPLVLNSELIEFVEATPDTVITLTTGQKLRVSESPDEVVERVIAFRRTILEAACHGPALAGRDSA